MPSAFILFIAGYLPRGCGARQPRRGHAKGDSRSVADARRPAEPRGVYRAELARETARPPEACRPIIAPAVFGPSAPRRALFSILQRPCAALPPRAGGWWQHASGCLLVAAGVARAADEPRRPCSPARRACASPGASLGSKAAFCRENNFPRSPLRQRLGAARAAAAQAPPSGSAPVQGECATRWRSDGGAVRSLHVARTSAIFPRRRHLRRSGSPPPRPASESV